MTAAATLTQEIAATAARLVVEEGLEYGPAKQRALGLLGRSGSQAAASRAALPGNEQLEAEVMTYLRLFRADTQPSELAALRDVALAWMQRLAEFRPYVTGAVWRGTATRLSDVHLQLYCDDPKAAEWRLIDRRLPFDTASTVSPRGRPIQVLSVAEPNPALGQRVIVHLSLLDHDDLRGALKPDAGGKPSRGDANALRQRMREQAP